MTIRSIARVCSVVLPANVLQVLDVPQNWAKIHSNRTKCLKDFSTIQPGEISTVFQKFCFLAVVKHSNKLYVPKADSLNNFVVSDINFIDTRYSGEAMQTIFNTNLLPMVSNCDKTLIFRVFQHSHSTPNPLYNTPAADIHYTLTTSFQLAQSGVFALTCLNMRKMFRHWCKQCALCVSKGLWLDQRGFTSGPEDPRLVSVLGQECLGFHTVSCDIFSEI